MPRPYYILVALVLALAALPGAASGQSASQTIDAVVVEQVGVALGSEGEVTPMGSVPLVVERSRRGDLEIVTITAR